MTAEGLSSDTARIMERLLRIEQKLNDGRLDSLEAAEIFVKAVAKTRAGLLEQVEAMQKDEMARRHMGVLGPDGHAGAHAMLSWFHRLLEPVE